MSPTSQRWMRAFAFLGAAAVAVPALQLAFSKEADAETAALCVFILLFTTLLVIGLLMDSFWSSRAGGTAEIERAAKEEWLAKP